MFYYDTASDASLIDDIDISINEIKYDFSVHLEDPELYDSDIDKLPEDLWQEQQDKTKLKLLEKRMDKLNELFWAYEALRNNTMAEIERLETILN